jgi:transposase
MSQLTAQVTAQVPAQVTPEVTAQGMHPATGITVGLDIGDRFSYFHALDHDGGFLEEGRLTTTPAALERRFTGDERLRIVLETGTHSPWVSRLLTRLGHDVIVANARRVQLISASLTKSDRLDAETLARLGRVDPTLLAPVQHRRAETQQHLALLRARDALVRTRTLLVNHVRGAVKATGARLPACSTHSFATKVAEHIPAELRDALCPIVEMIRDLGQQLRRYDAEIERLASTAHPETAGLRAVPGVGALTALCYVLVLEDPARFPSSRAVGSYLGLRPRRDQMGGSDPQLRITKAGDPLLRRLLAGSAQYILGPFGPDTDLRRWGQRLAARGGKNAKKRAVVAVARKLAVVLHHLWVTGVAYEPLHEALAPARR